MGQHAGLFSISGEPIPSMWVGLYAHKLGLKRETVVWYVAVIMVAHVTYGGVI